MNTASPPFASLPMYELPPLAPAWDRLWHLTRAALAKRGIASSEALRRDERHSGLWHDPDLLLGQTCGWPLVSQLGNKVVSFARFDFGLDTSRPGDYFSVFVGPRAAVPALQLRPRDLAPLIDDPDTRIAVNSVESQSGFRVLGECLPQPMSICRDRIIVTGSHLQSVRAVATGEAHIAAIDAVTWQFALEHEPAAREVCVVARSADAPGLPLITSAQYADKAPTLLDCLRAAIRQLPVADRTALHVRDIVPAERADYDALCRKPFGYLRIA